MLYLSKKNMKKTKLLILSLFIANFSYAQTSLMDSLIQKNYSTFKKNNSNAFEGKGWTTLQGEISKNNSVLLGEYHSPVKSLTSQMRL
ncbi:hypothetical protein L950_0220040 [Sphingobacterium sp. IITKGP-BTPF85]|nr:hypothetical protein L950_0220040 [Sphingobacterium sp. IITKGP-BTPF85]